MEAIAVSRRRGRTKRHIVSQSRAGTLPPSGTQASAGRAEAKLTSETSDRPTSRRMLMAAFAIAAFWWLTICLLALRTANPMTLNRAQLMQAEYIVTATIVDKSAGVVDVLREWKFDAKLGRISINNLEKSRAQAGSEYLMPLSILADEQFKITRAVLSIRVTIRRGEKIPFDGYVARVQPEKVVVHEPGIIGRLEKQPGDWVIAGSVVERGELTVEQLQPGKAAMSELDRIGSVETRLSPPYVYPATPASMRSLYQFLRERESTKLAINPTE